MRRAVAAGVRPRTGLTPLKRLIQDEPERVEVGLGTSLFALALLGRHVGERAEHVPAACERLVAGERRAAEVGELGRRCGRRRERVCSALAWDEHVVGLYVAVDNAACVGMRERVAERHADLEHLLVAELVLGDKQRQSVALDQLGDQVEGVLVGARLIQRHDRRVRQPCGGERLASRALAVLLAGQRDALERDRPVELLVVSVPHDAETARAEALQQPVATEQQLARRSSRALVGDAACVALQAEF